MADLVITGEAEPLAATNVVRTMWVESDFPVQLRIANRPIPETAEATGLLAASDFSAISYRVYREVDGVDNLVAGYESVAITPSDAIPVELPREWGKDGVGFNFRHVVPAAAFAANCLHRVCYRFVVDGETRWHPVLVNVQGPTGDVGSAGSGTVTGNPGPTGPAGAGAVAALWTQTELVTVENADTETPITGTGLGSLAIPANSFAAGGEIVIRAWGQFSTRETDVGTLTISVACDSEVVIEFDAVGLTGEQADQCFLAELHLIRTTAGASGEVSGYASLKIAEDGVPVQEQLIAVPPTVLPANAIQTAAATATWSVADAENSFVCHGTKVDYLEAPAA